MTAMAACLLTGRERAAIATIEVRGGGVLNVIQRNVKLASPREIVANEIRYGIWQPPTSLDVNRIAGESVVVISVSAETDFVDHRQPEMPGSGHPQGTWEIHCHGGEVAAKRILDDLAQSGVEICDQDAWQTLCGRGRLHQESLGALTKTVTVRTAGYVMDLWRGAMQDFVVRSLAAIQSDERRGLAAVHAEAADMLRFADFGLHLTKPWSIVLAGRPNVGKSSLINALVGYERSITLDQPGTTRDVLHAEAVLDGWPVVFADTAGIRPDTRDNIEREGITRAWNRMSDADLVIWVSAATEQSEAPQAASGVKPQRVLQVLNKIDLARQPTAALTATQIMTPTQISMTGPIMTAATTGRGIDVLRQAIIETLIPERPKPGAPLLINERQIAAMKQILAAQEYVSLRQALAGLQGD